MALGASFYSIELDQIGMSFLVSLDSIPEVILSSDPSFLLFLLRSLTVVDVSSPLLAYAFFSRTLPCPTIFPFTVSTTLYPSHHCATVSHFTSFH